MIGESKLIRSTELEETELEEFDDTYDALMDFFRMNAVMPSKGVSLMSRAIVSCFKNCNSTRDRYIEFLELCKKLWEDVE